MRRFFLPKFLMVFGCMICLGLFASPVAAQEDGPLEEDEGRTCADCHVDVAEDMLNSAHSLSFHNENFLATWDGQASDPQCLTCHASNAEHLSAANTPMGITCEDCHGETPASHPDEPIATAPTSATCGDCHATTHQEWATTGHGINEVPCTTCHNPHPQQLQLGGQNELCTQCHTEIKGYAHETHTEQACIDCHTHKPIDETANHFVMGSRFASGHEGMVLPRACTDCHSEDNENYATVLEILASDSDLLGAQVRIDELEAERNAVQAQGENTAAVSLIEGLILGLLAGAAVVLGVRRFRR